MDVMCEEDERQEAPHEHGLCTCLPRITSIDYPQLGNNMTLTPS